MSYSIKEAALKLDIAEITLRRAIARGEINYHKIGKMYRLNENDITDYTRSTRKPIDTVQEAIQPAGNVSLTDDIMKQIEQETVNLRHGIVKFSLHIVDGKPIRYTVSRKQSTMWAKDNDQVIDHQDEAKEAERVEKW